MIHMLIVDGQADELWLIQREAHEQAALLTDERWEIRGMLHLEVQEISESEVLDIVYLDVTDAQGLAAAMTGADRIGESVAGAISAAVDHGGFRAAAPGGTDAGGREYPGGDSLASRKSR